MKYDFSEKEVVDLQEIFNMAGKQGGLPWYGIISDLHKKLTKPFVEAKKNSADKKKTENK